MALLGFFAAMSASSMLADTASLLIALGGSILATFIVVVMGTRGGIFETSVVATPRKQRRWFILIAASQIVVSIAAGAVLVFLDQTELASGIICALVGLHFLPLAAVFRRAMYLWAGLLLCAIGAAGIALLLSGHAETARLAVGFTAAIVLWLTALLIGLPTGGPKTEES